MVEVSRLFTKERKNLIAQKPLWSGHNSIPIDRREPQYLQLLAAQHESLALLGPCGSHKKSQSGLVEWVSKITTEKNIKLNQSRHVTTAGSLW